MTSYFLFESKLFIKEAKNKLMFLAFLVFLMLIYFFISFQNVGDIEHTQYRQLNNNRIAVSTLTQRTDLDPELADFHEKVYGQQSMVARQDVAIRFENDDWFVDAGLELAQLQIDMHDYEALDELDEDLQPIIPSLHLARTDQAFLTYIDEESVPIMTDRESASGFLITFFEYFGIAAFLFLLLFSGSIISSDFSHQTMVKGYPLTYEQKTANKIVIYTFASFLSILILIMAVTGIIALFTESGSFEYPMVVYQGGTYEAIPLVGYALRYFSYLLVLAIHVISLSAFLNTVTKHMYATLIIGFSLYAVPFVIQGESMIWRFIPIQFYSIYDVMSGEVAYLTGQSNLSYLYGIGILLMWSMMFTVVVYLYQRIANRKITADVKADSKEIA